MEQTAAFGDGHLASFVNSLWTAATPVRFGGMWFPHVMTVVRLAEGSLVLQSPCRPSTALFDAIAALGSVAHVIAPNWFHDLYLAEYRDEYHDATFWGPPRLQRQLGTRIIDRTLDCERPPWFNEMPHLKLPGLLTFDESIFFHRASATLIVADLFTNLTATAETPTFTQLAYRLSRIDGRLAMLPYLRWFAFTVRRSLRAAAQRILEWDPQRLIVGHGTPIANEASAQLRPVCQALLN